MSDNKELFAALAKAQGQLEAAAKSSENPHFRSKYADLSEVWEAWKKVGPANGLSVIQYFKPRENGAQSLVTILAHSSGQSIEGEMLLMPSKNDMQGLGSATTYARRYSLAAMVGIVQDDDDGNAASGVTQKPPAKTPAAVRAPTAESRPRTVNDFISGAKSALLECKTKDQVTAWAKIPSNKEDLEKLEVDHPEKFEMLSNFMNNRYDELASNQNAL